MNSRTLVCKASPIGEEPVDSITIEISRDLAVVYPEASPELLTQAFDAEARLIVKALRHLPGGTMDRVLIHLLEAHASSLRVQRWTPQPEPSNEEQLCADWERVVPTLGDDEA
jgi:hypothetical protein